MTSPETGHGPDAPVPLDDLPRETLAAMLDAGREVLEWRRILAKTGDNVVGEVLKHEGPFYTLDHYPKGDVFDPESHAQWYYHAHDKAERPASTAISSCAAAACRAACGRRRCRTSRPRPSGTSWSAI